MDFDASGYFACLGVLVMLVCVYMIGKRAAQFRGTEMTGIVTVISILACSGGLGIALNESQKAHSPLPFFLFLAGLLVFAAVFLAGFVRTLYLEVLARKTAHEEAK